MEHSEVEKLTEMEIKEDSAAVKVRLYSNSDERSQIEGKPEQLEIFAKNAYEVENSDHREIEISLEEELEELEKPEDSAVVKVRLNSNSDEQSHMEVKLEETKILEKTYNEVENSNKSSTGEMRKENFLKILDEFEKMASSVEEKNRLDLSSRVSKSDKSVEKQRVSVCNGSDGTKSDAINGAKARSHRIVYEEGERKSSSLRGESSRALTAVNSNGSMRREKEWKRTLACKLFEERLSVNGGEGMDSLWEAYEMETTKKVTNKTLTMKKKIEVGFREEEEEATTQLCCLQALKLSAGKMNLGVGIPNVMKISKTIKGIGWLHSVSKHSKKVHNNYGDRFL